MYINRVPKHAFWCSLGFLFVWGFFSWKKPRIDLHSGPASLERDTLSHSDPNERPSEKQNLHDWARTSFSPLLALMVRHVASSKTLSPPWQQPPSTSPFIFIFCPYIFNIWSCFLFPALALRQKFQDTILATRDLTLDDSCTPDVMHDA